MEESKITLKSLLRVFSLSDDQVDLLNESDLICRQGKHFETGLPNAIFDLEKCDIDLLYKFTTLANIDPSNVDIFLSFRTEYSTRILRVPKVVNKAVKKFDCEVNISYTVL